MKAERLVIFVVLVAAVAISAAALFSGKGTQSATSAQNSTRVIHVVAAENFWGSLAGQLCGIHCAVTSIVTDPNADPHEYEASSADAQMIANANFVIVNGVGYDDWALQLIGCLFH